ncbi:MAG TPA: radical SAM protein [Burkholderiales bacterium]|nr:radical SAM protein [Burkholderiales bacterium]
MSSNPGAPQPRPSAGMSLQRVLVQPRQIKESVPGITEDRLKQADEVAGTFSFRLPEFYAQQVLNGSDDDPLLDIVLPSAGELLDGEEQWDATPSPYRASQSPFWVQKYEYQGLIRTTTFCSGLCRFCYLKRKNEVVTMMRPEDASVLFDDIETNGGSLREVILSGGDPLCASAATLQIIGARLQRMRAQRGDGTPYTVIHTREPVWNPVRLLQRRDIWQGLDVLQPKAVMINVLHPREVTPEFLEVCARLGEAGAPASRPALLCQHPVFRGVNDSAAVLTELYERLLAASPPILPYYFVHPFYNGTLPQHQLSLEASQSILRELGRGPGWFAPRMVVPTPWGKCVVGPHQDLKRLDDGAYELVTKDGKRVRYDSIPSRMRLLD